MSRSRRRLAGVVVLGILVGSCASASEPAGFELAEFSIDGPARLSPGQDSLTATNGGEFPHTLVITDAEGAVVAATDLIQPGETVAIPAILTEGIFQFTCRIVAQDGQGQIIDHYEAGMNAVVEVTGG